LHTNLPAWSGTPASTALLREAVLFTLSGRKGALARGKRPALTLPHLALIRGAHHELKTPLLSDREADSADYLTAAEILKGQLVGYPTDTYAHNGNEDLDRLQREHPDWSTQLVANGRGSEVTAHRRDGQGGLVSLFAPTLSELEAKLRGDRRAAESKIGRSVGRRQIHKPSDDIAPNWVIRPPSRTQQAAS
jgi:hypothetical protein